MQKVGLRHKTPKFCQRHSKKKEGSTVLHVSWLRNTYLPSIWPAIGLWTWVWEGLQLVSDCSGGWESSESTTVWVGVAHGTGVSWGSWQVCEVCAFVCPWGSLWLGAALCTHLCFLWMKIMHKQMQNPHYAQTAPLYQSHWNKFVFSKQIIAELTVPFLFLFPLVLCLTLPSNLQTGAVLPEEHFCLCI